MSTGQIAADDPDVGAMRGCEHRPARAALVTVELAGEQGLERQRVAFELQHVELEALLLGEAAFARHEHEAGVALGLDDAMAPGLQLLRTLLRQTDVAQCRPVSECAQDGARRIGRCSLMRSAP